jgi:hypothetical protein
MSECLDGIFCGQFERMIGHDDCVRFEGLSLQIPAVSLRYGCVVIPTRRWRFSMARTDWHVTQGNGPPEPFQF